MAKMRIRDQTSGGWVEVGGGAEEVFIGGSQPTDGEEIWIDTSAQSNIGMPTGSVIPFAANNAPAGWLLCVGQAVSRTTYANLFSVIGTMYGAGDGSTTFNLPNLQGRVPVGLDSVQAEFDVMGEKGGAKTHTLTTNEMPSHNHGGTTELPVAPYLRVVGGAGTSAVANHTVGHGSGSYVDIANTGEFPGGNHHHAIPAQGGGAAHNNMQPYIVLTYIVKT